MNIPDAVPLMAAWKGTAHALLNDRASRLIACIGACVTLGLCLLGVYLIQGLRDTAWRQTEQNATNLLTVIEHAVARNVELYDLSLRAVADEALNPKIRNLPPEIRRLALFDRSGTAKGFGAIVVTDAEGRVDISSNPATSSSLSFADMPDFIQHKEDPDLGLLVSRPRLSRVSGRLVVPMSRRLVHPDGSFGGIASGAIKLDYVQTLFAGISISPGSAMNLVLTDGTLLARSPYKPEIVGLSIAGGEPYRRFTNDERGQFVSSSAVDGITRLYTFARIEGFPLIVDVAVDLDSIAALWRPKALMIGALVAGLIVVTLALTLLLEREVLRRATAEASSRTANAELAALARTDSLTGLPNRRRYDEVFAADWRRTARTGLPLSLLVIDADHFKNFNDRFGHSAGDEVLKAIAGCLRDLSGLREATACRIGGEEFAMILPGLGAADAKAVAERVRRAVVSLQIPHAPEIGGVATVSIGLAHAMPSPQGDPEQLFADADAALYDAKDAGRNRVRIRGPLPLPPSNALSA